MFPERFPLSSLAPVLAVCRVLATAQRRSAELSSALARRGAQVVVTPTLGVVSQIDEQTLQARGPKALGAMQAAGLKAERVARSETAAELADLLVGECVRGRRIAVQHHAAGDDGLDTRLLVAAVGSVTAEPLHVAEMRPVIPDRSRMGALVRRVVTDLGDPDGGVRTPAGLLHLRASAATLDHTVLPASPSGPAGEERS